MPDTPPPVAALRWTDRALLLALSFALLLPGVFGVSLVDRDEGWYAQVSREMLAGGDWLVPRYLGEPWLAKPPLLYWCVAGAFAALGRSAAAARLVSVLASCITVQLVATLAGWLAGRRAALLAATAFLAAGLPLVAGKMVLTDPLLLTCTVAAAALLWWIVAGGVTVARSLGFWVCIGLGLLAKGPAIVLFIGALGLGLALWPEARGRLRSGRFWLAGVAALAVAAPWYAGVALRAGPALARQFLGTEVLARLTSPPHGHTGPPGYHVLFGLAGWLPWTALVPGAVLEGWRARRRDPVARLLVVWGLLPWLVLELVPGKLPHYALPCYVPLAMLLGRSWDRGMGGVPARGQRIVLGVWVAVPVLLGAGLVAAGLAFRRAAWGPPAAAAGLALALGFAAVGWLVRRGRLRAAWGGALGAAGAVHAVAGLWLLPVLEPQRLSRGIAERANARAGPDAAVLVCGYTEPTLFFYLDRPARVVSPAGLVAAAEAPGGPRLLVVREQELAASGLARGADWECVRGLNYVRGRRETVWIGRAVTGAPPRSAAVRPPGTSRRPRAR